MSNPDAVPPKDSQWPPGQSGNPAGREVGSKNLSTIIKRVMESEIDWDLINIKDAKKWAEKYKNKSAWEALIYVAFTKGMTGDVRAMEWLGKAGYGEKYVHEAPDIVGEVLKKFGIEPTEGGENAGKAEETPNTSS